MLACDVKRGFPLNICQVNRSPSSQQRLHHLCLTVAGCIMKRGVTILVSHADGRVGPEQFLDNLRRNRRE